MIQKIGISVVALTAMTLSSLAADDTVKIGMILPLTGPFAIIGRETLLGAQVYLQQNGDTFSGKKIELLIKDDASVADTSKRLAQEMIVNDKVTVLLGIGTTPSTVAVAPIATQAKIPMIVTTPSTSAITNMSPYIVRTGNAGPQVISVAGDYFGKHGVKTAVTLVSDFGPGIDHEEWFKKSFEAAGGKVVDALRSPFVSPEFSPYLQRVADNKPGAVFIFVPTGQNATLMRQFADRGLGQSGVKLLAAGDVVEEAMLDQIGDVALGAESAFHYSDAHPSEMNKAFVKAFEKASDGLRPNFIAVGAYDGVALVGKALAKTQGSTDGTRLLEAMKGMKWESPRGPMEIDPATRDVVQNVYLRRVEKRDGHLVNAEFATFEAVKDPAKASAK